MSDERSVSDDTPATAPEPALPSVADELLFINNGMVFEVDIVEPVYPAPGDAELRWKRLGLDINGEPVGQPVSLSTEQAGHPPHDRVDDVGAVWLSAEQAATATGRSARTIRRKAAAGAIPGAEQDYDGTWRIPAIGLLASGLLEREQPDETKQQKQDETKQEQPVGQDDELARLRAQVLELSVRLEGALELVAEKERSLERADRAMRMLTGGTVTETQKQKRKRWRRQ